MKETDFSSAFKKAEFYEFAQKDFSRAADSYRKCALSTTSSQQKALDKIRASSGTQFSPEFVRIFLKLMEKQNPGAPLAPHAPGEG